MRYARRIEFVTTIRVFDDIISTRSKILDCAAGTGIYAFWFADKGHDVTATDMSCFADDSFDVVLNMGPFYHLIAEKTAGKVRKGMSKSFKKRWTFSHGIHSKILHFSIHCYE